MSVDLLYNDFDDPGATHEIIWSDGSSSAYKIKFMVKFLQHSVRNTKAFLMEIFTANHGTRVADGIGSKAKSLVQLNVMSKGNH